MTGGVYHFGLISVETSTANSHSCIYLQVRPVIPTLALQLKISLQRFLSDRSIAACFAASFAAVFLAARVIFQARLTSSWFVARAEKGRSHGVYSYKPAVAHFFPLLSFTCPGPCNPRAVWFPCKSHKFSSHRIKLQDLDEAVQSNIGRR